MVIIGMDIHRSFAQAAFLQDGRIKREQRVELIRDRLIKFAKSLSVEDEVVIEATSKAQPLSGSCGLSSNGWWWRIRGWFAPSPTPG
jgi:hypothetical protein